MVKQYSKFKDVFKDWRLVFRIALAAVLVAFNWGLYISAVNADKILDASLGYYINPLVAIIFGVAIFKEQFNSWQITGIFLAGAGVLLKTFNYGRIPWISLGLAISFAFYGAIKKASRSVPSFL